jgi:hypothetical protein
LRDIPKIPIEDTDKLIGDIERAIEGIFGPLGDKLNAWVAEHAPDDQGIFKRGIDKEFAGTGLQRRLLLTNDAEDEEWVLEGRPKGGGWPNVGALLGWIKRQWGIDESDPVAQRQAYFKLAVKIMRDGIDGHPLYDDVMVAGRAAIAEAVSMTEAEVARILNGE